MADAFLSYAKLEYLKGKLDGIYGASISVSGSTITLKAKDGTTLASGTITQSHYDDATTTTSGLMSATDKVKLDGVTTGANKVESNTNGSIKIDGTPTTIYTHPAYTNHASGLYKITVDSTGHVSAVASVTKSDITGLGIPTQDTTYSVATDSVAGLMGTADRTKLNGISSGATKVEESTSNGNIKINGTETTVYTPPAQTAYASGLYKITTNATGAVTAATAVVKADITRLGIPTQDTTYSVASTTANGLLSSTDKTKLDTVSSNANANVIETVKVNNASLTVSDKAVNIDLSSYALKSDISSAVNYKGTVATYADLPTSPTKGDMYNITTADETHQILAGENVVWTGEAWDDVGGLFTVAEITEAQIDALFTTSAS